MNAAFFLIGYFLISIGVLLTLSRMDGVPMWGTMAAGFVLAGIGVLFALRRFTLDDGTDDPFEGASLGDGSFTHDLPDLRVGDESGRKTTDAPTTTGTPTL